MPIPTPHARSSRTRLGVAAASSVALATAGLLLAPSANAAMPPAPLTCLTPVYAINAGGPEVTTNGRTWQADTYGRGGHTWTTPSQADIAGTDDDVLYRSERAGHQIAYRLPVDNGTYQVRLHMAEIWWSLPYGSQVEGRRQRPGKRVESFNINGGRREVHRYDPAADAGRETAVTKSFIVQVRHGKITIRGTARVDMAQLAAVEVNRVTACAVTP